MIIHSNIKDYSVDLVEGLLNKRESLFKDIKFEKICYFVDAQFFKLYQEPLKKFIGSDFMLLIDAHEQNKSFSKLTDFYRPLINAGFKKNDLLVTFGGGILQDISGFIASTLYRGIPWVYVPTTLLAQADSCIGSKTSINFGDSKNLIGTFYPPDKIFIDTDFCKTLPDSHFNSGVGEIIKFHLLSDEKGVELLKKFISSPNIRQSEYFKDIILSTLSIKKSYFESDEFDTGRRNLLNYGHTFGHALESASNFSVAHGEAVIIGMGLANRLALKRNVMSPKTYDELEGILKKFYPSFNWSSVGADQLISYMKKDKKRTTSDLTAIITSGIGAHEKVNDVKEDEVKTAYAEFVANYPQK
jgi:3-dehydroquinate synthase